MVSLLYHLKAMGPVDHTLNPLKPQAKVKQPFLPKVKFLKYFEPVTKRELP